MSKFQMFCRRSTILAIETSHGRATPTQHNITKPCVAARWLLFFVPNNTVRIFAFSFWGSIATAVSLSKLLTLSECFTGDQIMSEIKETMNANIDNVDGKFGSRS